MSENKVFEKMGHKRIKDEDTTTYVVWGVMKLKNNPKRTRWSQVKERMERAMKREFGEDLID